MTFAEYYKKVQDIFIDTFKSIYGELPEEEANMLLKQIEKREPLKF